MALAAHRRWAPPANSWQAPPSAATISLCVERRFPMKASIPVLLACLATALLARGETLYVEAESFRNHGGWALDTAFIENVGSPYLLAHGLGQPVHDAETTLNVAEAAEYGVWVRTKDWVAPWKAPGTPGRFQLVVNGEVQPTQYGTTGAQWHWQPGGKVKLPAGEVRLALRDLTGFDGRCDALLFSSDAGFVPPEGKQLAAARRRWLNLGEGPEEAGEFDLVVIGGGYSGLGAAISAARQSLKVALVQDRFVLGGNGSSEVRVWANGGTMRGKYPHLGEIVEEFADHAPDSPGDGAHYGDELKAAVVRNEKNIQLFLGHFAHAVEADPATQAIRSVTALDVRSGAERRFRGRLFVDCTGHGTIGALAGAAFRMEPKGRMGMSNMWYWQHEAEPQPWPATPWALSLVEGDFPATVKSRSLIAGKPFMKGEWFWESGFDKDPLGEAELIRDWNLRAVYGAFTAIKQGKDRQKHATAALKWVAHVGGPRESRMLDGDVLLTREDIVTKRPFPDASVSTTWDIDLHYPKETYAKKFPENPFISRAEFGAGVDRNVGYPIPYRCFYSKNVPNLFMAGRNVSVTHEALGTIRVMRTCGMMGEVVGKAAYLCVHHNTSPRGVYEKHLPALIELMQQPGNMRRDGLEKALYRDPSIGAVRSYLTKGQDQVDGLPAAPAASATHEIALSALPGIVVDDTQAQLTGTWGTTGGLRPFVGEGYRYAAAKERCEARFPFRIPQAGKYEVRVSWVAHENRGQKVPCTIERANLPSLKLRLDQQEEAEGDTPFHSLGRFDFAAGAGAIVLSSMESDGVVHADAVQLVPVK
jgi:hypothetical protein